MSIKPLKFDESIIKQLKFISNTSFLVIFFSYSDQVSKSLKFNPWSKKLNLSNLEFGKLGVFILESYFFVSFIIIIVYLFAFLYSSHIFL